MVVIMLGVQNKGVILIECGHAPSARSPKAQGVEQT